MAGNGVYSAFDRLYRIDTRLTVSDTLNGLFLCVFLRSHQGAPGFGLRINRLCRLLACLRDGFPLDPVESPHGLRSFRVCRLLRFPGGLTRTRAITIPILNLLWTPF